ncbi:S-adenosyl-L-methionine-dependent methyltransferase [Gonapodya prolifera JEL478]|uniref:S-adenosyl-L-methionine-dependent methyltransferase n=1 Tax=Gonapodya prolifera (strain JEL478) TaxID=1344416 RepID=A0A139ABX1_GONPJ|nr:S-adenosyl-L-methionine-dependent methyltransferase [Gonapodya prolifera JEL478]|eukprot:KXS14257.1 S-adenosyl-L-methionine-dependent methyltransferase [Gonapodya prolifera JEL478]
MPDFPTPDLSHLTRADFRNVYEPAEDTFLLMDAIEEHPRINLDDDRQRGRDWPSVCLEIGSGSGCVSTFVAKVVGRSNALFLTTDVNPHAARATRRTGEKNEVTLDPVVTDLASALLPRLRHSVDLLIFNPPYVPTESAEVASPLPAPLFSISASWAGGVDGREVVDRFLPFADELLAPEGVFLMVLLEDNAPEEIIREVRERWGWTGRRVKERRAGRERLVIVEFVSGGDAHAG